MTTATTPRVSASEAQALVDAIPHWHHRIEVVPGVFSRGAYDPRPMLDQMGLPERLDGLRVLDIGANDGFFSFELERRGAQVVAVDHSPPSDGFRLVHRLRGSNVEHRGDNVYDLTPARHGMFDIVLLLGVIYHLRHPLLAIDVVSTLCRDLLLVETHGIDDAFIARDGSWRALEDPALRLMQFYPNNELAGDWTNWWGQSLAGLESMIETALFRVEHGVIWSPGRALVRARVALDRESEFYRGEDRFESGAGYFPPGIAPRPVPNWGWEKPFGGSAPE